MAVNVILVIVDSLRADHVGCYLADLDRPCYRQEWQRSGSQPWVHTPTLDALARESVRFTRAFPEALPTLPVRRAIHTGVRSFPFRDYRPVKGEPAYYIPGWQPIPEEQVTLAEILGHAGYRAALITDTYHQFGPGMNFHRGFDQWLLIRGQERDRWRSPARTRDLGLTRYVPAGGLPEHIHSDLVQYLANTYGRRREEDWFAPQVFRAAIQWLEENHREAPFLLVVDCFDPHEPWDPPPWYTARYDPGYEGREIIMPAGGDPLATMTQAELRHVQALYAGEVTMMDRWLGRFLVTARDLGVLDDSLLLFIADHGHPLGEHRIIRKAVHALYPELMDIPFLIRHPQGLGAGSRVDAFVYDHDILPTVLAQLGLEPPLPVGGRDLFSLIRNPAVRGSWHHYATSAFGPYVWCRDDRYAYVASSDGSQPRLYDLSGDPGQFDNVAADAPHVVQLMWERVCADAGGPPPQYDWRPDRPGKRWFEV